MTSNEPELWLIRHGQTEWARDRRHTGRSDIPLLPEGEAAAAELAPRLAGVHFDLQLSSPLQRAWRTAELAGLSPKAEPDALEWDYGRYEGITTAQIQETVPGWSVWSAPVPEGETLAQVAARADAVIERVRSQAPTRAVLVAHAHYLRILAARWIGQAPELGAHLALETSTLSVLGWNKGFAVINTWNS